MPTTAPLRHDAAVNLQRLLDAGRAVFARRGLDATLNEIADAAGVGVGTAYRRFRNKAELLDLVVAERIAELDAVLTAALKADDPWQGVVDYLEHSLALQAQDRALTELFAGRRLDDAPAATDTLTPQVNKLVKRAVKAGVMRDDVRGTDLLMLQIGLLAISRAVDADNRYLYRRYLAIALDGLRPGKKRSELPVEALGKKELRRVLSDEG